MYNLVIVNMKLYLLIFAFWLIVGIFLVIYFPVVTDVVRMPTKLGSYIDIKTSNYTLIILWHAKIKS